MRGNDKIPCVRIIFARRVSPARTRSPPPSGGAKKHQAWTGEQTRPQARALIRAWQNQALLIAYQAIMELKLLKKIPQMGKRGTILSGRIAAAYKLPAY
jgi:hypothetical protein